MKYILALDQGTTSSRAILFDHAGGLSPWRKRNFHRSFPNRVGWNINPNDIWSTQAGVAARSADQRRRGVQRRRRHWHHQSARDHRRLGSRRPASRSATPLSGRTGARPRLRSAARGGHWRADPAARPAWSSTPIFPATKLQWILGNVPGARAQARRGRAGLRHRGLVAGLEFDRRHACTSPMLSNASRTMLLQYSHGDGTTSCSSSLECPRSMLAGSAVLERSLWRRPSSSRDADPDRRASPAINRRRFSGRPAISPAWSRTPTAPAASCS